VERGDYDRAIALAHECLRKSPNFANAHFGLGRALAKQQRFAEARAAFQAAIDDAAYSGRQFVVDEEVSAWKAHSEIGSSYGYEGDDERALEWFDRALVNRPMVVPVRMNRAKALERLGRFDEAEAMYKGLADDEPGDAHSADYINFLLRREKFAAALETIEDVLAVVTPRARASLLLTAAKLVPRTGIGDVDTYLSRALAAHSGAADVLEAVESVYRSRGDLARIEQLHEAERNAPMDLAPDFARRGSLHLRMGRLRDAEAVTRAGLAVAPTDAALLYNLGAVLVQTERKVEALDALGRATADPSVGARAAFLRSIVLGDLGRYAEALAEIDIVIERAPREVDARLQRFRLADALGRADEAEETLRCALGFGDSRVAAELAAWLLRKGRFTDAKVIAERALQSA
jgi:tetratricopeptide (TPR) repeat protein